MKIIITGGHLTPAVALIEKLKEENWQIMYVGKEKGVGKKETLEAETMRKMKVEFKNIITGSFMVRVNLSSVVALLKIPVGFVQSVWWIISFKPDIIFSFGGYMSAPVCLAGKMLGVSYYLHEQTEKLGIANSLTARCAKKIFISYKVTKKIDEKFAKKMVYSGNLIRKSVYEKKEREMPGFLEKKLKKPIIFVTGGNQGAHKINTVVGYILEELLDKYCVIHQTGNAEPFYDYERFKKLRNSLSAFRRERYIVVDRVDVDEMSYIFQEADLVVGRAGANTVTEVAYFGVAAVLVPLAISSMNEQDENARRLEKTGLAVRIKENELDGVRLLMEIEKMLCKRRELKESKKKAREVVKDDAVEVVYKNICKDEI